MRTSSTQHAFSFTSNAAETVALAERIIADAIYDLASIGQTAAPDASLMASRNN